MYWEEDALKELKKVPAMFRGIAKKAVENAAYSEGKNNITAEDVTKSRENYLKFAEKSVENKENKTRIAVVRCETVSEVCPGTACFKAFNMREQAFKEYENDVEIIGFITCGGCPGRRISRLVNSLKKFGLDAIHLSSCMLLDGNYPKCPHIDEINEMLKSKEIRIIKGTHH
ncbi:hypothetical protein SYNTR_1082 [Candidatus Syntrophocurvum alkaliphilum]|uniref:CGGC domain-containing protein n=1 Tax=Candidatus Syntrophocurvum alkaliphilum TaxID=2293317 RepID=A0A6I6DAA0_9FIRM|nr:CGGC domain-containing protein [Candidatus Syntrophocurvum alkaliphilum]QGT99675.1 hypothetical protein SYNTR_1082 [Candidatus Syntrophocurvum alkaliphilum]